MSENFEKRTSVNVSEKASLIWDIANKISGLYKPHEYGKVILPLTVIKRFNDTLLPTHQKVLEVNAQCDFRGIQVKDGFLQKASGYKFYNTSAFTFEKLLDDADNIEENLRSYLASFSENVIDVLENFDFDKEITKLAKADYLYTVIQEFCTEKAYMGTDKVSSADMGYIFEELIRKFSESYNEEAGAHFTARDIIYLMTDLLIAGDRDSLKQEVVTKTVYDMAMGTSQMLGCLTERIKQVNEDADVTCFGQELNPETFAIAKADMLIKGGNPDDMRQGDTLSNDQFKGYQFDYIISNPPFGIDWKVEQKAVTEEANQGENGRFPCGLPPVSDGQMLFLMNGVSKLKSNGRMAIIQNSSPLVSGDAGSGQSNIREYLIKNDYLEAIIQLPSDMFYNTGITTYIWLITKDKCAEREGKVQLIDASNMFKMRRKPLGKKRKDFSADCIDKIKKAYMDFETKVFSYGERSVESKVFENNDFKYKKVVIETPVMEGNKPVADKKGRYVPNVQLRTNEQIPFKTDNEDFMKSNIYPFSPYSYIDESKTKYGYEISFTKYFYKYVEPEKSDYIFEEIREMKKNSLILMKEMFEND